MLVLRMRKCKYDGNRLPKYKDSNVYQQAGYCDAECSLGYLRKKQAEQAKKQRMALRASEKARKPRKTDKLKSDERSEKRARMRENKPHQLELTRVACNRFIRALDEGEPCISCGRYKCGARMEAGHFKSVGSHPELRFDPRNIYLQGSGCNQATSKRRRSNLTVAKEYEQRLIAKMGQELVDWLNGPHEPKHYTCDDLRKLRQLFNDEYHRLEKGEKPSRDWRKLDKSTIN